MAGNLTFHLRKSRSVTKYKNAGSFAFMRVGKSDSSILAGLVVSLIIISLIIIVVMHITSPIIVF